MKPLQQRKIRCPPPRPNQRYSLDKPHKSFIKRAALLSHGPSLLSILLIASLRQQLSIFAKRFSQSLTAHRQQLTAEGVRGSGGANEMLRALSPSPHPPPPLCGQQMQQRSASQGSPVPELLQRGELGARRAKSSQLWIVLIGLPASPPPPPPPVANARFTSSCKVRMRD